MADAGSRSRAGIVCERRPLPVVWRDGGRTVVFLRGEQDVSTGADLADALASACASGGGDVTVDLSEVVFMDGAIITELARGRNALRSQSRALMLRAPTKFARRLLEVCGLVALIDAGSGAARVHPGVVPVPVPVPVPPGGVPAARWQGPGAVRRAVAGRPDDRR